MEEGRMGNSESALRKHFADEAVMRVAMEAGTHSPWVSRLLKRLGHQVLVANPRKIRAITGSESKNDRNDAEQLARFAAFDPKLLSPIEHRSEQRQQDLNLIHARATLVRARTMIINVVRGLVKSAGGSSAQLLHGVVCRAYKGCHSGVPEGSIDAAAEADRSAHGTDRSDG